MGGDADGRLHGGGSSSDTVDGFNIYTSIDAARASALFEQLVQWNNQGQIENRLADEFSPNSDGSVWTIRRSSQRSRSTTASP